MNIAIVCANEKFCLNVSKCISEELSYYFLDIKAFLTYDLINKEKTLSTCGAEYLLQREIKAIKNICEFEKVVCVFNEDIIARKKILEMVCEKMFIIYFDYQFSDSRDDKLLIIKQQSRKHIFNDKANFKIKVNNKTDYQECAKFVLSEIGELIKFD